MRRAHDDQGGGRARWGIIAGSAAAGPRQRAMASVSAAAAMRRLACGTPHASRVRGRPSRSYAAVGKGHRCAGRTMTGDRASKRVRAPTACHDAHWARQLLGEPIAVDFQWTRVAALVRVAVLAWRRACHSVLAAVPRGRPLGEPSSIPRGCRVRDETPRFQGGKRWKARSRPPVWACALRR